MERNLELNSGINTGLRREKPRLVSLVTSGMIQAIWQCPSLLILAPKRKSLWRSVFISVVTTAETGIVLPINIFPKMLVVLNNKCLKNYEGFSDSSVLLLLMYKTFTSILYGPSLLNWKNIVAKTSGSSARMFSCQRYLLIILSSICAP